MRRIQTRKNWKTAPVETLEPMTLMSGSPSGDIIDGSAADDVLVAAYQGQTVNAGDGCDLLLGMSEGHSLNGEGGDDSIFVTDGANSVDGGDGCDTVTFWGVAREDARVIRRPDGSIAVVSDRLSAEVRDVETFVFHRDSFQVDELNAETEYRSMDGTGNSLESPNAGSSYQQLIRLSDVAYEDGVESPAGEDRPSARTISNVVAAQETVEPNRAQLSDMVWVWGQFLDHDLSLTEPGDPRESLDIKVPEGDVFFDPTSTGDATIGLDRSVFDESTGGESQDPRQQINEITAWIDGSMIYGSSDEKAAELRSFEGGRLITSDGDLLPIQARAATVVEAGDEVFSGQFIAGDVRANENVALTAMHTVWLREHNRVAAELASEDSSLSDDELFERARQHVIALVQHVTWTEFLPTILPEAALSGYSGYDSTIDPSVANEFSTAAFRFGHTMLTPDLQRLNSDGTQAAEGSLALRNAFFSPDEIRQHGIDSLLMGASVQQANEIDTQVIDDVRNFLFGDPGAGGFDLASLNIQRGRDHGLPDYNSVRVSLGLIPAAEFSDVTSDLEVQRKLQETYSDVNQMDLWVAGLAEDHVASGNMGETFTAIIADQFIRLRDADRFWYEAILNSSELAEVKSTTLADVISRNTNLNQLRHDVFRVT